MPKKLTRKKIKRKRKNEEALSFDGLVREIKENKLRTIDLRLLRKAYDKSKTAHKDQKRSSGEPFFIHPYSTTQTLIKYKLDTPSLATALLHDVVEDTDTSLESIKKDFGPEVARLVKGISKLKQIEYKGQQGEVENLRKMFLAMAKDIRVVLIKLADRLHNMKTLEYQTKKQQQNKARETLDIYAPIADRLGMGEMKGELEDLSFPYAYPEEYKKAKELYDKKINIRRPFIISVKKELKKKLIQEKVRVIDIHGRLKHLFSFHQKLTRYNEDLNQIFDIVAVRIIVKDIKDCYASMGTIHNTWKPLVGRIKDYISTPKANGYQSLHTTVTGPHSEIIEIQIRTPRMHEEAEYGIAAHWAYKTKRNWIFGKQDEDEPSKERDWVKQLSEWQKNIGNPKEFLEALKIDFFKNRIFVLTPTGEVIDLPEGSTAVDFAYHVHTEIGNSCSGAKVNGKITKLDSNLQNGDIVEIIKSKTPQGPKRDWLDFVQTNLAKNRIRAWLRNMNREQNIEIGKKLLDQTLQEIRGITINKLEEDRINEYLEQSPYKNFDDLLVAVGHGDLSSTKIVHSIYQDKDILPEIDRPQIKFSEGAKIKVAGQSGVLVKIAQCCKPSPGDKIVGCVTVRSGIKVHKKDCSTIKSHCEKTNCQILGAHWETTAKEDLYPVPVTVEAWDRVGLLGDVCTRIADIGVLIRTVTAEPHGDGSGHMHMILDVKSREQLSDTIKEIKKIPGVYKVRRD